MHVVVVIINCNKLWDILHNLICVATVSFCQIWAEQFLSAPAQINPEDRSIRDPPNVVLTTGVSIKDPTQEHESSINHCGPVRPPVFSTTYKHATVLAF